MNITYEDNGSSHSVACHGNGTPYSDQLAGRINPEYPIRAASPTCGWVYQNPSEGESIAAEVTYDVTWTVTGAAGGGDLGTLASPPTDYDVKVYEIQAIVTPNPKQRN